MAEGFAETAAGGRLWYEAAGEGPGGVFVHPGLWDARVWDPQWDAFVAAGYRVVRYDLRNFGRSDDITGPFSSRQDLADVMDAAGVDRAAVVGCSMGGGIAIDFALEFPSRVQALVAAAPGVFGLEDIEDDERTVALEKEAGAAMEAGDVLAAVEFELEIWTPASDDPENDRLQHAIAMDNTRAMTADWSKHIRLDPPAGERLDQVAAPTLVILGTRDAAVMEEITDVVAERVPGARKAVIEGADHLPMMRRPEEFNRLVLEFLSANLPGLTERA